MTAKLRLVTDPPPSPEELLCKLIPERDRVFASLARIDALIAQQGRLYVRERGEFMAPSIERLRRELT